MLKSTTSSERNIWHTKGKVDIGDQTKKLEFETKSHFEEPKLFFSRRQVIKNLSVIAIAFLLFYTAYGGLSMLQNTMNQQQGIGAASQAIMYVGICISALLLPKYTIQKLGCKRTLLISMSCYIPYTAANFYFNWFTVVPSAFLCGLASSLLWNSQATYYNKSSCVYSMLALKKIQDEQKSPKTDESEDNCELKRFQKIDSFDVQKKGIVIKVEALDARMLLQTDSNSTIRSFAGGISEESLKKSATDTENEDLCTANPISIANSCTEHGKPCNKSHISKSEEYSKLISSNTAVMFGAFGLLYHSADISSNLLSYYVLQDNKILDNITESSECSCGASFCNVKSGCFERNLEEPSQEMKNALAGISLMILLFALLVVFLFLDELGIDKKPVEFSFNFAKATCKFIQKKESLLLLPLTIYVGLHTAFYVGDFTKSYTACARGVRHVVLVSVSFGVGSAVSAMLSGFLVKCVGRVSVLLLGALIDATLTVYLLIWNPLSHQSIQYFMSSALWGFADGIFGPQLKAFYGVIFKSDEEAAFAGFSFWYSIGFSLSFAYSNFICTYIKIYILLTFLIVGIIGYLKTELLHMQHINKMMKA